MAFSSPVSMQAPVLKHTIMAIGAAKTNADQITPEVSPTRVYKKTGWLRRLFWPSRKSKPATGSQFQAVSSENISEDDENIEDKEDSADEGDIPPGPALIIGDIPPGRALIIGDICLPRKS